MKSLKKIPWGFILKFVVAFGLITYLVQSGLLDFSVLMKASRPEYLVMGFFFVLANIWVNNVRWTLLLKKSGIECTMWQTFKLCLMGIFFNFTLPSSVGGDVVKAYYLARDNADKKMIVATSVLVDRVIGLFGMVGIAFVTLLLNFDKVQQIPMLSTLLLPIALVFFGMFTFFMLAFSKRVNAWPPLRNVLARVPDLISKMFDAVHGFGRQKMTFVYAVLLTLTSQVMTIFFMYLFAEAIGMGDFSIGAYFFAVPVGLIVMSIPIAPAGLGVGQVAFLALFTMYTGVESQVGPLSITAFQVFSLMIGLFGAGIYLQQKKKLNIEAVV
tara:strand:- start:12947 stop:13927 length:981 start_codon:yes stop_codon:yes gene_type:complete